MGLDEELTRMVPCTPSLSGMPPELILHTFSFLDFPAGVAASHVSKRLRSLAIAERRPWQVLPPVTLPTLLRHRDIIRRSGQLELDLSIRNITQPQLRGLSVIITTLLPRLRMLQLVFLTNDYTEHERDLQALWFALHDQAPLLQTLRLLAPRDHAPLAAVPSEIFLGNPPEKLSSVRITAFELPVACGAFKTTPRVGASVAVLTPNVTPMRVHDAFPGVAALVIARVEFGAMFGDPPVLSRLPRIDRSLNTLVIYCRPEGAGVRRDSASVEWLGAALPFVRKLKLVYPECPDATDAIIDSLAGAVDLTIRIRAVRGLVHVRLSSAGLKRTVAVYWDTFVLLAPRLSKLGGDRARKAVRRFMKKRGDNRESACANSPPPSPSDSHSDAVHRSPSPVDYDMLTSFLYGP
ncbi:hypothetical protein AURDEDRAFT_116962 [Auricularia subglabra TFB-10046 SS5]|uniref:F-box domain-containing protein n=1 Tax=Auricularia subglabra (strain TFB-10046 / SS5) TaxID=717982 RepID=J0CZI7_AURST|nr:hypothetical protein AURDEDRAFT_116962 [Auricularia subglabra TFB-10046 SS5]